MEDYNSRLFKSRSMEPVEICFDIAAVLPVPYGSEKEPRIIIEGANKRGYSKRLGLWHNLLASLV
jgi:hypothetical protein